MAYTITLNPALDRTLWVEKIQPDDSNRIEREEREGLTAELVSFWISLVLF